MPNLDLPQTDAAGAASAPLIQPTLVPTERTLQELSTGGWRRRLSGLPTALGRTLAGWAGHGRSALADLRGRSGQDAARQ
jgi:hypothetical protein